MLGHVSRHVKERPRAELQRRQSTRSRASWITASGEWHNVVSSQVAGTGVYADMRARGQLYATVEQTTGEITIVRDGSAG